MGSLPVIFVSHGAPVSLEDQAWMDDLGRWGQSLGDVQSILVLSAHWVTPSLMMGPLERVPLLYDFWGFPERFYRVSYKTVPALDLARAISILPGIGKVLEHESRGLDHGMWVPLKGLFPQENFPVLGVSLPGLSPPNLYALGKSLGPLRRRGVLILASGGVTHNLTELHPDPLSKPVPWAIEFDQWVTNALESGRTDELLSFESKAPHAQRAHPTSEHFAPLFVALGAAEGSRTITSPVTGFRWGTLSLRSFQFDK